MCVRSTVKYGLVLYWHTLKVTEAAGLIQIPYRAARVVSGARMFTNQFRLEGDLSWESVGDRAKFLGLNMFHKIHLNVSCSMNSAEFTIRHCELCYQVFRVFSDQFLLKFFWLQKKSRIPLYHARPNQHATV